MNKSSIKSNAQAGFTLIELIVVIVILGILAATALPKFADLGADARVAKMRAAAGSVQTAASIVHGTWMVKGAPEATTANSTSDNSVVLAEGLKVAFINGYPDVGGDGATGAAGVAATSGIVVAAGGLSDYDLTTTPATATVLTVRADSDLTARQNCYFTYTEATGNAPPVVDASRITLTNCK